MKRRGTCQSRDNRGMPIVPAGSLMWLSVAAVAIGRRSSNGRNAESENASDAVERERMVTDQILPRGIRDAAVVSAMRQVPRHLFVPAAERARAYDDHPLPIGHGQTISQPYVVALMTELARPAPSDRALEVGTGCGYQAAVLSRVVNHVFSVEIDDDLSREAAARLSRLGYTNVTVARADGYGGWASEAPFDIVMATAAPTEMPHELVDQLAVGGRLVIPVGPLYAQELLLIEKEAKGRTQTKRVAPVRFVPMVHGGEGRETGD
jgi:protein-L-isoaspartate(D-aspartate) O-methyltransferase